MQNQLNQFTQCKDRNEVKSLFRSLAKSYHPDTGGNAAMFKLLVSIYETALDRVTNGSTVNSAEYINPNWKDTAQAFNQDQLSPFADLIAQVKALNIAGISIIQRDQWLWVENTRKTDYWTFRKLGFNWSRKRKAFYFAENLGKRKGYASKLSKEDLDRKYNARSY